MEHEWKPYGGRYEKVWYDIELEDGDIIYNCYPNAGTFHTCDQRMFTDDKVKRCRITSRSHPMMED